MLPIDNYYTEIERIERVIEKIEAYVLRKDHAINPTYRDRDRLYDTCEFLGSYLIEGLRTKIEELRKKIEPEDLTIPNFIDDYIATHGEKVPFELLMQQFS